MDNPTDLKLLRWLLIPAFLLMLLTGYRIRALDNRLNTPEAPHRIVSLELAWTPAAADNVVASWASRGLTETAIASIIRDYAFLVGYSLFLTLAVLATSSEQGPTLIIRVFAALAVTAGLCDIVENYFMTRFLLKETVSPLLFAIPATVKFSLLVLVILYFPVKGVLHWMRKPWAEAQGL